MKVHTIDDGHFSFVLEAENGAERFWLTALTEKLAKEATKDTPTKTTKKTGKHTINRYYMNGFSIGFIDKYDTKEWEGCADRDIATNIDLLDDHRGLEEINSDEIIPSVAYLSFQI